MLEKADSLKNKGHFLTGTYLTFLEVERKLLEPRMELEGQEPMQVELLDNITIMEVETRKS